MVSRYFVVEGKNDEIILRHLLPDYLLKDTRIIVSGGYSSALSAVQTLFTLTPLPISLFFDTDSCIQDSIEERKDFINSYLQKILGNEFFLFPMIPEMEILFIYEKELLAKLTKQDITEELWQKAHYQPKTVLQELAGEKNYLAFLENNLTRDIIEQLQQNPLLQDIVAKLISEQTITV